MLLVCSAVHLVRNILVIVSRLIIVLQNCWQQCVRRDEGVHRFIAKRKYYKVPVVLKFLGLARPVIWLHSLEIAADKSL